MNDIKIINPKLFTAENYISQRMLLLIIIAAGIFYQYFKQWMNERMDGQVNTWIKSGSMDGWLN